MKQETKSILIIDDDTVITDLISRYLQSKGFHVVTQNDGESGLNHYLEHAETYHLILLDLQMPAMDGQEVLSRIRNNKDEQIRSIPVIIISGENSDSSILACDRFLRKPFQFHDLLSSINSLIN